MHVTISALSVVTGKCVPWPFDKRFVRFLYGTYSFCPLYIRYSSVSWPFFPLVDRSLSATCPVRMRYSCVLCASYTFGDDLHRHRDDFHHRINFFVLFLSVRRPLTLSGDIWQHLKNSESTTSLSVYTFCGHNAFHPENVDLYIHV